MSTQEIKKLRTSKRIDYRKSVLVVSRSNKNIMAQVLEPVTKRVIFTVTSSTMKKGTKTEKSTKVGEAIVKFAKKAKITEMVANRNGNLYHGRVQALFEAVRNSGIKI